MKSQEKYFRAGVKYYAKSIVKSYHTISLQIIFKINKSGNCNPHIFHTFSLQSCKFHWHWHSSTADTNLLLQN